MVQYSLNITQKNTNQQYRYTVDLEQYYEDEPTFFFTPIVCNKIKNELESQSKCQINDMHLKTIIKTWIQDIKEGYRDCSLILDLPVTNHENIHNITELGNQEIPPLIYPEISNLEPKIGALPPLDFS
ncbi:MAG: hypothetical protein F6K22_40485 [Okeania sp. SIO2F4]|uniref:hypothetical protein n=1 Tax=Okeania sp. SIO2F4 TaxID=2607790 RepID=UPI00142B22DF|nr:hypothetical protein [Okeania sp. SIO2F4]NES08467.1 hypothetical protein [Okeania sp. SIO2F4]